MPPKKMGVNSKAEAARARKSATESERKEKEAREKDEQYWREAEGAKSRAAKKREEESEKKAEAAARKAEAKRLAELEEKEMEKSLNKKKPNRVSIPVPKVTEAELIRRKEAEEAMMLKKLEEEKRKLSRTKKEEEYEKMVLVENTNRDDSIIEARSVEEAIAQMSVSDTLPADKHPEKRLKASFKAFEEAELPKLKEEKPGLTHTQYKDMIWKLWKKSPDNPLNQVDIPNNLCARMTMGTSNEDPINRAFEAIARREAHDLHLRQQKISNINKRYEGSSSLKRTNQDVASSSNAANTPSKKGKYSFTGQMSIRDAEADHPIYLPVSHPVNEKLAMQGHEVNVVDKILDDLLRSGDSAQNYIQGSRKMKIDNRIHLDNRVQERKVSLANALQSHSKRFKKHMSMKQHKKCGSLKLPQEFHNFEKFKPMHEMWKVYILQLLKSVGKSQMAQCLLGADLHGAHILVAECKMVAFKGVSGIMIRETAETFGIITKENKFKVVLKKISVFMLQIDCWKITLHGDKLTSRKVGQ